MFWEKLEQKGIRGKEIVWNHRWKDMDEIIVDDFYLLGSVGIGYKNQKILERVSNIAENKIIMPIPSIFFIFLNKLKKN